MYDKILQQETEERILNVASIAYKLIALWQVFQNYWLIHF